MNALPAYLDHDGLLKYFPSMREGSDTLTAYLVIESARPGGRTTRVHASARLYGIERGLLKVAWCVTRRCRPPI